MKDDEALVMKTMNNNETEATQNAKQTGQSRLTIII